VKHLLCLGLLVLAGCDGLPFRQPNDTDQVVWMDVHGRDFPTPVELKKVEPGGTFGTRQCWKKSDSILLATKDLRDPIVLDPKDFCTPGKCSCELPVSKLVHRLTPDFVIERQKDVCGGRGPFLQPEIRGELCKAYLTRIVENRPGALFYAGGDFMFSR
jgi:hypothetical protein